MGDQSFPGSDPAEYEGGRRDFYQEWVPDPKHPEKDRLYLYGTKRRIPQEYTRFYNPGDGSIWINNPNAIVYFTWDPLVPNNTYQNYPNQEILQDQNKSGCKEN